MMMSKEFLKVLFIFSMSPSISIKAVLNSRAAWPGVGLKSAVDYRVKSFNIF